MRAPFIIDDRNQEIFRVHRSAFVDPDVLTAERETIFDRCWLYVGHESEVAAVNDFRTRDVGGRPVIMTRDAHGNVNVLINSCPHRGMEVESRPEGNGRFLKCFYHGWSFDTAGQLVALRDEGGYGASWDRADMCLPRPPLVESYRGFVFLNWDPDAVPLVEYLAGATTFIDLVADQSPDGMEVIGGSHQYSMRANWKLLVENSFDQYHAMTTHQRYVEMLKASGREFSAQSAGPAATGTDRMPPLDLGNGHAVSWSLDASEGNVLGGLGRAFPSDAARAKHLARRAELVDRFGERWANRILGGRNHLVFPNLFLIDLVMGATIRTFHPVAPDYMEVSAWQIVPRGEDPELRAMRMANFLTFWGPAGLATPDDVEALERCQQGFRAHAAAPWNDLSRGMNGHLENNEAQMRVFWRRWNELVTGEQLPPEDTYRYDEALHGRPADAGSADDAPLADPALAD